MKNKSIIGTIFGLSLILMMGFGGSAHAVCFAPTCTTGNFYIANNGGFVTKADGAGNVLDSDWAADAANYIPTIDNPKAVAVDSLGNVYVGFASHNVVMKFDSDGNVLDSNFAATIPTLESITIDSDDNLYVAYTAGHASVMKFDITGTEVLPRFIPGFIVGQVLKMEFDSAGNLNFIDVNAGAVKKFIPGTDPNTDIQTIISGLNLPLDLALDSAGNIYVSVNALNKVEQYDSSGTLLNADFTPDNSIVFPRAIAFDSDGFLYAADADAGWNRIKQFAASGGAAIDNSFVTGLDNPRDIAFETMLAENILLADVDIGGVCEVDLSSGSLPFGSGDPINNGAGVGIGEISEVLTNTLGNLQSSTTAYVSDWTNDDGWNAQTSGTINFLYDVSAVDDQTAWAVGTVGEILHTTDGGATWSPQTSGTTEHLYGVTAVDSLTAWAVGVSGTILKTTDGGNNWNPQTSGTSQAIEDISAVDDQTAWAVGDGGAILKTTNGGGTWSPQTSGTTNPLYGISVVDANTVWVVGWPGMILKTTNGGTNWNFQCNAGSCDGAIDYLLGVSAVDANTAWAVGGLPASQGSPVTDILYTDDGATWTKQTTGTAVNLAGVSAVDASTAWAVGLTGIILYTSDAGTTWTQQTSGTTHALNAVSAVDANNVWSTGGQGGVIGLILHNNAGALTIMDGAHSVVSTSSGTFASKTPLSTDDQNPTVLGNISPQDSITTYWDVEVVLDGGNPLYSGDIKQIFTFDFTCI